MFRSARVRHPVLGVDGKRMPKPGHHTLNRLDELHAKHRRRRYEYHGVVTLEGLLKVRQRFPVEQP